jgi:hypothetical protein
MARLEVKIDAIQEGMYAKLDAHHERMMAMMDSHLEKMEAMVNVFEERFKKMETTDLEANPEERESKAEHEEVPKEEAAVQSVRALKERYGDWHLAIELSQQLKKRT